MPTTVVNRSTDEPVQTDDHIGQSADLAANILLVDDHPAQLAKLETILQPLGHRLITASSHRQAVDVLSREEVAVVLIDVPLPGLNVTKTAELMRSRRPDRRIPVIFLTAAGSDTASILAGQARGMVDLLTKPLDPELMRCRVSVFVDLFFKERTIKDQADFLRQNREALTATNQIKDEFLATLSHELRNPLNAIMGWLYLLRAGNLDPAMSARAIATIERNVQLQVSLIDEILDLSRIGQGKVRLALSAVDLIPLIESALDAMRPAAEAKGLLLTWKWNGPPVSVNGDSERLRQVISNLVSNAVKSTPPSGRVSVALERGEHDATLTVSDTGKGFSAEFLPFVFDMLRQSDSTINSDHHGLGLGLAIARSLIELHQGRISVQSDGPGKGATFSVSLPLS